VLRSYVRVNCCDHGGGNHAEQDNQPPAQERSDDCHDAPENQEPPRETIRSRLHLVAPSVHAVRTPITEFLLVFPRVNLPLPGQPKS
jgi:hypothetical protein